MDIKRGENESKVYKAIEDYKLEDKFKKSNIYKKNELRKKRANLTDFDRFKVMRLRQKRSVLRHKAINGIKGKQTKKKAAKK